MKPASKCDAASNLCTFINIATLTLNIQHVAKSHISYCGLVCGLHMEKTVCGIPIHLNYCVIFLVHTQFTNVAMGCVVQTGRAHAVCARRV